MVNYTFSLSCYVFIKSVAKIMALNPENGTSLMEMKGNRLKLCFKAKYLLKTLIITIILLHFMQETLCLHIKNKWVYYYTPTLCVYYDHYTHTPTVNDRTETCYNIRHHDDPHDSCNPPIIPRNDTLYSHHEDDTSFGLQKDIDTKNRPYHNGNLDVVDNSEAGDETIASTDLSVAVVWFGVDPFVATPTPHGPVSSSPHLQNFLLLPTLSFHYSSIAFFSTARSLSFCSNFPLNSTITLLHIVLISLIFLLPSTSLSPPPFTGLPILLHCLIFTCLSILLHCLIFIRMVFIFALPLDHCYLTLLH